MAAYELTNDHADWTPDLFEMILFRFVYRFQREMCPGIRLSGDGPAEQ